MAFDPRDPAFFDTAAVEKELARVTEICDGCRRCHRLCPSFDFMLDTVDEHDGDVSKVATRRLPPHRRPLLAVQALLQPLPVHAAAPLGHRLPAADAAREGGAGEGRGRHAPGPLAGRHRPRGPRAAAAAPLANWANAFTPAPRAAGGGGRRPPRPQPAAVPPQDVRALVPRAAAARRARRRPREGRALLLVLGQLQRAAGRTRRGGRARAERLRGQLPGAGLLRHAVPGRRRHRERHRERPAQPGGAAAAGRGGRARSWSRSRPAPTC